MYSVLWGVCFFDQSGSYEFSKFIVATSMHARTYTHCKAGIKGQVSSTCTKEAH